MNNDANNERSIREHYGRDNLSSIILAALEKAGKTIRSYQDTAAFDEFHMRGRAATRELARLADLRAGFQVLDIGCGLGGPSRLLAAEYGCTVTGIDLMEEYVEAATMLTQMVGLTECVSFVQGNMLDLPFEKNRFDSVWSQHTMMNIADKARLLAQIRAVLKPDGLLAFYEIVQGPETPLHFPVQWASDASINYLLDEQAFRGTLASAGFAPMVWQDTTAACLEWFEAVVKKIGAKTKDAPAPLGLNLVIGRTTAQKAANTARNLKENRIRVVYGVMKNVGQVQEPPAQRAP
jgi:ubiquinone/menaquinone biosynthesis C-methylase UbiE